MRYDLRFLTALKPVTRPLRSPLSTRTLWNILMVLSTHQSKLSGSGAYTVRGFRMALRDRWVLETVNVMITPVNASLTRVALSFDIR